MRLNEPIMSLLKWRIGRVVEGGGFENRCTFCVPGVRIPHSPPLGDVGEWLKPAPC